MSIVEIDNKECHRCSKLKTPVELVYDKLIMYLDVLQTSNFPRKIDYPKFTILEKDTVGLDEKLSIYFQESLFEDVIC